MKTPQACPFCAAPVQIQFLFFSSIHRQKYLFSCIFEQILANVKTSLVCADFNDSHPIDRLLQSKIYIFRYCHMQFITHSISNKYLQFENNDPEKQGSDFIHNFQNFCVKIEDQLKWMDREEHYKWSQFNMCGNPCWQKAPLPRGFSPQIGRRRLLPIDPSPNPHGSSITLYPPEFQVTKCNLAQCPCSFPFKTQTVI